MTPQSEFVPVGKLVIGSRLLELDFIDQQNLIAEMKQTGKELETSPLVKPSFKEVKLGRIALLGLDGEKSEDKLWVQFSETSDNKRSAAIDLLEEGKITHLKLSHTDNEWQVWPNGAKAPTQTISNEQVVAAIHPKLRNKEALGPLQDLISFESMMIPHLLASYLEKSAHRREKKLLYKASDALIQGIGSITPEVDTSLITAIDTELGIFHNNGRSIHRLATRAPYKLGTTEVKKEYSYHAETSDRAFYTTEGKVSISSTDGYNQMQLENYASSDQFANEPLYSLHRSLGTLRAQYGLEDQDQPAA